jgi:hypothetical protein
MVAQICNNVRAFHKSSSQSPALYGSAPERLCQDPAPGAALREVPLRLQVSENLGDRGEVFLSGAALLRAGRLEELDIAHIARGNRGRAQERAA